MIQGAVLVIAYLLGSIPTALIMSKRFRGVDIRTLGDGNMGARNTSRTMGAKLGIVVAVVDFLKGVLAVLLANLLGLALIWQILAGICAILGHDFSVFARFKGGQGLATSLGTMLVLFPTQMLLGSILYGILFLTTKKSSISAGFGCGLMALLLSISQEWMLLAYAVVIFVFMPLKQFMDSNRRKEIEAAKAKEV